LALIKEPVANNKKRRRNSTIYSSSMKLTFICTSTTGSATKLDALEYQLGSSSYPKENKADK
jgi:hypothetical protein